MGAEGKNGPPGEQVSSYYDVFYAMPVYQGAGKHSGQYQKNNIFVLSIKLLYYSL